MTGATQLAEHTLFADDQHWASGAQAILDSYFYYLIVKAKWPQLAPQAGGGSFGGGVRWEEPRGRR